MPKVPQHDKDIYVSDYTFIGTIYVGFKELDTGITHDISDANKLCQEWVDEFGQCVTVTPTTFIYSNGNEPGCAIGFIHYLRYPESFEELRLQTIQLAQKLLTGLNQYRVSIVFPNETIMIGNGPLIEFEKFRQK